MYSLIHDGKVLDYHYKKIRDFEFQFYVGSGDDIIKFGSIFRMDTRGRGKYWTAVLTHDSLYDFPITVRKRISLMDGFKTRTDAAEYLLKLSGFKA